MDLTRDSSTNNNVPKKLPFKLQIGFGVGHVLNDICSSMWFTYLLVFFHLVLEFDNWEAGFMLLVGQVADAIANPFVGFHSDKQSNTWLCSYGKRKTWHLLGTVCVLCAFPFIFSPCLSCAEGHKWAQMLYYSVFIIIFQFGWAAIQISHLSLIPELSPNPHDRTRLASIRYSFTVISNILVYVIAWIILGVSNENGDVPVNPDDISKFQIVVWVGLFIGILCTIAFHIIVKEPNYAERTDKETDQSKRSFSEIFCNIRHYQVATIYMCTMIYLNSGQVFIPLYLHESLNMPARSLALIPLIAYLASFIMSFGTEKLNRSFGRTAAYLTGTSIGLVACLWIFLRSESPNMSYEINFIVVLYGFASSIILVTSLGITADLIGNKTGSGAFVYGIMCFTDKLANGTVVFLIQHLHKSYPSKMYYKNVITCTGGGAIILSSLVVITLTMTIKRSREYLRIP